MTVIPPKNLFACLALTIMIASGCRTLTPIGPGQLYEPNERERRLWETSRRKADQLINSGVLHDNEELEAHLNEVLERVLSDNVDGYRPLQPVVHLLDSPQVNAFAHPVRSFVPLANLQNDRACPRPASTSMGRRFESNCRNPLALRSHSASRRTTDCRSRD